MNTEIPPTVTPDALTAILHKRADAKLRQRISAMFPSLGYDSPLLKHVAISTETLRKIEANKSREKHYLPYLLEAAREGLFDAQFEAARAAEVAEFLAKVETTAAELDAIREEMHQ